MNFLLTTAIRKHIKSFKGAMIAFNATALLVILGVAEATSPEAHATTALVQSPLDVCIKYAQSDDGYNFTERFNSCASVLNIQQLSFEF